MFFYSRCPHVQPLVKVVRHVPPVLYGVGATVKAFHMILPESETVIIPVKNSPLVKFQLSHLKHYERKKELTKFSIKRM